MDAVISDLDKLATKQATNDALVLGIVDQLIARLRSAKDKIATDGSDALLTEAISLKSGAKPLTAKAMQKHKEFYNTISKHGKLVDKAFKSTVEGLIGSREFAKDDTLVLMAIALDFIRQGQFQLSDTLLNEAGMEVPLDVQQEFKEMFDILEALDHHDVTSALRWVDGHRAELKSHYTDLEFQLHKMAFIQLLTEGQFMEALRYSKDHLAKFNDREKYFRQIKQLSCSVLYANGLRSSPYGHLLAPSLWTDVRQTFMSSFCRVLGLADQSPLYLSVTVGAMALPGIIKMATIMKAKKTEWSQDDELPIEVNLPVDLRFHSTFVCPVSKEQATEANPPMMLPCGHVICLESLNSLYKGIRGGNRQTTRIKCPYCPAQTTASEAQEIYF